MYYWPSYLPVPTGRFQGPQAWMTALGERVHRGAWKSGLRSDATGLVTAECWLLLEPGSLSTSSPAQIQTLIPNTKPVTPFQTQGPTPPGAALCKRLGLGGEQQPRGAPVGRWAASAAPGLPSVHGGRPTGPAAPDLPGEPGPRRAAQGGQADRQGPPAALAPTTCPRERTPSLPAPELPRTPPSASPALAGVRVVFVI